MRDYVRPAIRSEGKCPANSEGVEKLREALHQASQVPRAEPDSLTALPVTAERISGRVFRLAPNPFGLLTMTLTFISQKEATFRLEMALDADQMPEYRLGLDGLLRITPARYGLPAAGKARWVSEETLVIDINELGNINRFRITVTFEGDAVSGKVREFTGLGTVTLEGKMRK
jgi:hypothetical protein